MTPFHALTRAAIASLFLAIPLLANAQTASANIVDSENRTITLTHAPCQMLEPENGIDRQYDAWHETHCRRINKQTKDRLNDMPPLVIESGEWTITVKNRDVNWPVGFWLRAEKVADRLTLPKAELGGHLSAGESKSVTLTLPPGNYVFSCPLNPTPLYRLTVVNPG